MSIDLDKLMQLHAESNQGEHVVHDVEGFGPSKTTIFVRGDAYPMIAIYSSVTGSRPQDRKNAEAAAAFHNAMPALLAEVRAQREVAERHRKMLGHIVAVAKREGVAFHANKLARAIAEAEYLLAPEPKHDLRFCKCHCVHGVDLVGPACAICENST